MQQDILRQKLAPLDKQDYGAYQSLLGEYEFPLFKLIIQQIPKDPYAPPHTGIYRIQVRRDNARIINRDLTSHTRQIAFRDFLARHFFQSSARTAGKIRGTGYSGIITVNEPGQAILERNSIVITEELIEVRCFVGLPAHGRDIDSRLAQEMLLEQLPEIVNASLLAKNVDSQILDRHLATAEDAEFLRDQLEPLGLVAFIADGAVLPRASGTSDQPLPVDKAITFTAPESLAVEIDLPHAGHIRGMGIGKGITLITGGGYHGKSTLLDALELGIYNHIPGDGRELCVSNLRATKVRAYSGRYVVNTDISPFIRNLPYGKDTTAFSTDNASGSTSQAANIVEAIEAGTEVLLMDEDTCATNFMIRDAKMQQLVSKDKEPITTFIDRARQLYLQKNISTVLVLGGVGDYFDISDRVIQMIDYRPADVTSEAHRIAEQSPTGRAVEDEAYPVEIHPRIPLAESISPLNEHRKFRLYAKEVYRLHFGRQEIDLTDLEQLMELSQTKALGYAIDYAKQYMDGEVTLRQVVEHVQTDIEANGLDILSDRISGHFAAFRALELAFAINRLRGFKAKQA
ncbi:MAG: ABC-ATPase domain-containing protein [Acidiferrobacterales bacterium]